MRRLPFFRVERSRGGNYRRRFQASHAISLRWYICLSYSHWRLALTRYGWDWKGEGGSESDK